MTHKIPPIAENLEEGTYRFFRKDHHEEKSYGHQVDEEINVEQQPKLINNEL